MEDFKTWLKCVLEVAIVVVTAILLGFLSYFIVYKFGVLVTLVLIIILLGGTMIYAIENNKFK